MMRSPRAPNWRNRLIQGASLYGGEPVADELTTTIVAGSISLIGTFGSILLNHHLAGRQQKSAPTAAPEQSIAHSSSSSVGWFVPLVTLLLALGLGYWQQALSDNFIPIPGQSYETGAEKLSWLGIIVAVVLLWWRARRDGAGFRAFLFDMLILSGGWIAGASYSNFNEGLLIFGVVIFVSFALVGGLAFLIVRLVRRRRLRVRQT